MKYLIESIVIKDYDDANSIIEESLYYIIERKMIEKKKMIMAEKNAWNGMPSSRQEKLYRDVIEEDEIDEMASSSYTTLEKPDASGKKDLGDTTPSPSQNVDDIETDDLIRRNTEALAKERSKIKSISPELGNYPLSIQREERESGEESSMARSELNAITKDAKSIMSKVKGNKELEAWTQSKITKAADYLNSVADYMDGEEKLDEARIKLVKARIRGGKIERRKRVSNIPGMTLRGGQLKRMSAAERRRRKLGQRKGKLKRKAKMARTLMKRQRSLRRRKSLGI
jgi:hypothetical protein